MLQFVPALKVTLAIPLQIVYSSLQKFNLSQPQIFAIPRHVALIVDVITEFAAVYQIIKEIHTKDADLNA